MGVARAPGPLLCTGSSALQQPTVCRAALPELAGEERPARIIQEGAHLERPGLVAEGAAVTVVGIEAIPLDERPAGDGDEEGIHVVQQCGSPPVVGARTRGIEDIEGQRPASGRSSNAGA